MQSRQFKPVEPGQAASAPQHRGETSQKEERRQAGTPATLEGNIDNAIDRKQDTVNELRAQGYATRWLVSHYPISATVAAIIATELRMGGA
jgi:flagellar biosynthesis/type III secretory pathway M-ring protein FliF/YscJ